MNDSVGERMEVKPVWLGNAGRAGINAPRYMTAPNELGLADNEAASFPRSA
jgi:hypothetical protein